MYKVLMWSLAAVALVSVVTLFEIGSERGKGPALIAGPVSEEQIRQKLLSEGWTDLHVARNGRHVHVVGLKSEQADWFTVDAQTGRLRVGGRRRR